MKEIIYAAAGLGVFISGFVASMYIYFWLMFLKPIIMLCQAVDQGVLTGKIIEITIAKVVLGGLPAGFVFLLGYILGKVILEFGRNHCK